MDMSGSGKKKRAITAARQRREFDINIQPYNSLINRKNQK